MPVLPTPMPVEPGGELDQLLDTAAAAGILLEKDGVRYYLTRVDTPAPAAGARRQRTKHVPERVLNIIGRGASAQLTDIAQLKDRYVAEAAERRGE